MIYFWKNIKPFFIYSKCSYEYEKIFKEEELIEILKALGLINKIEEY